MTNKTNEEIESNSRPEVVVVTGASAGVGQAVVRRFAYDGAHIGLIARGLDGLEGARNALGGKAIICQTDISDPQAVERAAEKVEDAFGPIDVWINNARILVFNLGASLKLSWQASEYHLNVILHRAIHRYLRVCYR